MPVSKLAYYTPCIYSEGEGYIYLSLSPAEGGGIQVCPCLSINLSVHLSEQTNWYLGGLCLGVSNVF